MPKTLRNHCAVSLGNNIYIHGGFQSKNDPNIETFILDRHNKTWETILVGPDCGIAPKSFQTTCAIWNNRSMVVPTFDITTNKTCTGIFDLATKSWKKLKVDGRFELLVGGTLGS